MLSHDIATAAIDADIAFARLSERAALFAEATEPCPASSGFVLQTGAGRGLDQPGDLLDSKHPRQLARICVRAS